MLLGEGLCIGFGQSEILVDADVRVRDAEIVSVMGPSGSGKSSLLACLAGLLRPRSGRVVFNGQDVGALSESGRSALRLRRFGFVFQFGDLVPELSLVENVELPLRFSGLRAREARARAVDALDLLGVAQLAGRRTYAVSGGELQRAAVARALVHSPAVVFADEPTGALDEANGQLVLSAFIHAAKVRETSVVLATHDATVASAASRQLVVRAGRLEEMR